MGHQRTQGYRGYTEPEGSSLSGVVKGDWEIDLAVSPHSLRMMARDNSRIPMQVSHDYRFIADVRCGGSKYSGFTVTRLWMRLHDDHTFCNVAVQSPDPDSS